MNLMRMCILFHWWLRKRSKRFTDIFEISLSILPSQNTLLPNPQSSRVKQKHNTWKYSLYSIQECRAKIVFFYTFEYHGLSTILLLLDPFGSKYVWNESERCPRVEPNLRGSPVCNLYRLPTYDSNYVTRSFIIVMWNQLNNLELRPIREGKYELIVSIFARALIDCVEQSNVGYGSDFILINKYLVSLSSLTGHYWSVRTKYSNK